MVFNRVQRWHHFSLGLNILFLLHFVMTRYIILGPNADSSRDNSKASPVIGGKHLVLTKNKPSATNPVIVVLLSSLPRSGSSVMGELILSMDQNNIYFFEPDFHIKNTPCIDDAKCLNDVLAKRYNCKTNRSKHCTDASSRVIKMVRGSLKNVGHVLADPQHQIKLIHLTRDPRGALSSIHRAQWDSNPERRCKEVHEDMETFERLLKEYPGRIMNISYERFSTDSELYTKKIHSFLYGAEDLPKRTVKYMHDHLNINKPGFTNLYREASSHYQKWRKEITKDLFNEIESEQFCKSIISKMGYNLFGTITKLRDYRYPYFV